TLLAIASFDRDEPANIEHDAHDRKAAKFRLVENAKARMKRLEQDRWIDVALVIRTKDHRGRGNLLSPGYAVAESGKPYRAPHAQVPERVHAAVPTKDCANEKRDGTDDQDVKSDKEVGNYRADGI